MTTALFVLVLAVAWCNGYVTCSLRVQRLALRPWLRSIRVGDPNFWLRHRDYAAVWQRFVETDLLTPAFLARRFVGAQTDFDTQPETLVEKSR